MVGPLIEELFFKLQKEFFFLSGPAINPPPLLVVGPLVEEFVLRLRKGKSLCYLFTLVKHTLVDNLPDL